MFAFITKLVHRTVNSNQLSVGCYYLKCSTHLKFTGNFLLKGKLIIQFFLQSVFSSFSLYLSNFHWTKNKQFLSVAIFFPSSSNSSHIFKTTKNKLVHKFYYIIFFTALFGYSQLPKCFTFCEWLHLIIFSNAS